MFFRTRRGGGFVFLPLLSFSNRFLLRTRGVGDLFPPLCYFSNLSITQNWEKGIVYPLLFFDKQWTYNYLHDVLYLKQTRICAELIADKMFLNVFYGTKCSLSSQIFLYIIIYTKRISVLSRKVLLDGLARNKLVQ